MSRDQPVEVLGHESGIVEEETDYFLGPVLGRGATGFAYEGFRRADGLDVVIKVLSKKLTRKGPVLDRIREDVACASFADLRHKNVARTIELVEIEGRPAVVMQHAPGRALSEILEENGPITDRRALKLILQLVEGLIAGLRRELHHGDIRPKKLFVDTRGRLWISDFGMAYACSIASRVHKYANIPFGQPEYLAPEIIQSGADQPTEASDLYAVGITLYELVCGTSPFKGMSARDTLRCHLEDRIPPPPRGIQVSPGVADLILSLTAKDPKHRTKSLVECFRKIKGLLTGRDPMDVSMSADEWTQASGAYALAAQGWDAARLEPKGTESRDSVDEDEPPEVLFPPGEFMSGTGFFKPQLSGMALYDPFDEARRDSFSKRVVAGIRYRIENFNLSGRDLLLAASLLLNLALVGLILKYGLRS